MSIPMATPPPTQMLRVEPSRLSSPTVSYLKAPEPAWALDSRSVYTCSVPLAFPCIHVVTCLSVLWAITLATTRIPYLGTWSTAEKF